MLVLLDQENVSYHGLTGISALQKKDKIVTFLGKDLKLSDKIKKALEEGNAEYEIHQGLVGTKNAADYQLISYLTYSIISNNYDEFVVLSRDTGFDISINYLKDTYPDKKIYRVSCILEYIITKFLELNLSVPEDKSSLVYKALLASRYSSSDEFRKALSVYGLQDLFPTILPYLNSFQICLKSLKLDTTVDSENLSKSVKKKILESNSPLDTYDILASILDINYSENKENLRSIRRAIRNSKNFDNFSKRILSNENLLEIKELKRCSIPKKIKPYYNSFRTSISRKG